MSQGTLILTEVGCVGCPLVGDREPPAVAYYVKGCIQEIRREMLVDTGASVTMISEDYFKSIPNPECQPTAVQGVEGVVAGSQLVGCGAH